MSYAALTARYRPQTFAQVAGQDTLKAILSRASLEGRVAPAYLFSGTRGVGKTTLARIFAKALNCRTAPTGEPCNQCDQCRAVTMGSAVDVVEIDGASNRGIDDMRRLKEVVGYAPMEGGYKIFIIDEAHMLSREAFNALLKTLEEPPARVTFILATTEPHKFPATITSRCQHFVFKRLPENSLTQHLAGVLDREGVEYEAAAVRLIARRGAGSVRDSMSLLGQVLALGEDRLTESSARKVLGLVGQDAFMRMLDAFRTGDTLTLSLTLREMLDQGLDMGFFLRELSSLWRNLFMLRQSGEAALSVVDLPENEARSCLEACRNFSLQHIHACWQMTLEGQRRVLVSLEPALALELLLLNLAMLPRLLSLEQLSSSPKRGGPPSPGSGPSGGAGNTPGSPGRENPGVSQRFSDNAGQALTAPEQPDKSRPPSETERQAPERGTASGSFPGNRSEENSAGAPESDLSPDGGFRTEDTPPVPDQGDPAKQDPGAASLSGRPLTLEPPPLPEPVSELPDARDAETEAGQAALSRRAGSEGRGNEQAVSSLPVSGKESGFAGHAAASLQKDKDWQTIFALAEGLDLPPCLAPLLRRVQADWRGDTLVLAAQDAFSLERLNEPQAREGLERLLLAWCGGVPDLDIQAPAEARKSREELQAEIMDHPLVRTMLTQFGAKIIDYGQMR